MMQHQNATIAAGIALVVPASLGILLSGVPTILCPFPLLTVIPAFLLGRAHWLAVLVPSVVFFAWNPGLFRGQAVFPKRSIALLTILTALTGLYFMGSWRWGIQYQGPQFVHAMCLVNSAWLLLLWVTFWVRFGRPSFAANLLLHWMLFAGLAWFAFPYLGELP